MTRQQASRRFPRSAYLRRVWKIMEELEAWEWHFKTIAARSDSPVLAHKALERANGIHEVWHDLMAVQENWKAWT